MERLQQSADAALMIRPARFYPNPETAEDNSFQRATSQSVALITAQARAEFDAAVDTLRGAGVTVHVVEDTETPEKPDAVFPNNWISTHHDGRVVLYPMYAPARRQERRHDVVEQLRKWYRMSEVVDLSRWETDGECLEGTGSLVFDHEARVAYVSLSRRTHRGAAERFCIELGYRPVIFRSATESGSAIYHTNVMMCVGSNLALVGLETITDQSERQQVRDHLERSGKKIVELNRRQISEFAGNGIELRGNSGALLVLSARATASLRPEQRTAIERHARILPLALPTIELAGGSARCMIAAIHLRRL